MDKLDLRQKSEKKVSPDLPCNLPHMLTSFWLIAMVPGLASYAKTWKSLSNIMRDGSAVIPICGKKETMLAQARRCPNLTLHQRQKVSGLCEDISPDSENIPPSQSTSQNMPQAGPPPKRAKTSTTPQSAELPQWNWTAALRGEFSGSLLDLFAVCGIPFNVADNVEFEHFILRWIPGAKIQDRRDLAGSLLEDAVRKIEDATGERVAGKFATGQSDGWRNIAKTDVITSMMSVDREVSP